MASLLAAACSLNYFELHGSRDVDQPELLGI
jgi:hypothetical protein